MFWTTCELKMKILRTAKGPRIVGQAHPFECGDAIVQGGRKLVLRGETATMVWTAVQVITLQEWIRLTGI